MYRFRRKNTSETPFREAYLTLLHVVEATILSAWTSQSVTHSHTLLKVDCKRGERGIPKPSILRTLKSDLPITVYRHSAEETEVIFVIKVKRGQGTNLPGLHVRSFQKSSHGAGSEREGIERHLERQPGKGSNIINAAPWGLEFQKD